MIISREAADDRVGKRRASGRRRLVVTRGPLGKSRRFRTTARRACFAAADAARSRGQSGARRRFICTTSCDRSTCQSTSCECKPHGACPRHQQSRSASSLDCPLPPLAEQRAIAHILGTLDDKIELNRRMNETLEAMARALFKSWFVDFDPVRAKAEGRDPGLPKPLADLFPARLVDSELGEIPEGWEVGSRDRRRFLERRAMEQSARVWRDVQPDSVWRCRRIRSRADQRVSRRVRAHECTRTARCPRQATSLSARSVIASGRTGRVGGDRGLRSINGCRSSQAVPAAFVAQRHRSSFAGAR